MFHIVAHRGASAYAPDNSLEAFGLAREHSATDVEVDVHCTKDGWFVVRHDSTISNPAKFISEVTIDEYRALCDQRSERCVDLVEVINVAKSQQLGVYLDIKQVLPGAVPNLVEVVNRSGYKDRIVVASFRTDIAKDVKETAADICTSVLFHDPNLDLNSLVKSVGCDFLHPCFDIFVDPLRRFTNDWVERALSTGAEVMAWNITTVETADVLVASKARGACADDPQLLHNALNRYQARRR